MSGPNKPHGDKAHDKLSAHPLPDRTFEKAVAAVMHAPPLPEQQAKKAAAKARREERKRQRQQQAPAESSKRKQGKR